MASCEEATSSTEAGGQPEVESNDRILHVAAEPLGKNYPNGGGQAG